MPRRVPKLSGPRRAAKAISCSNKTSPPVQHTAIPHIRRRFCLFHSEASDTQLNPPLKASAFVFFSEFLTKKLALLVKDTPRGESKTATTHSNYSGDPTDTLLYILTSGRERWNLCQLNAMRGDSPSASPATLDFERPPVDARRVAEMAKIMSSA